jgi:ligand-binding sensor domain-containing protein
VTAVLAGSEPGSPWVGTFGGGVQKVRVESRLVMASTPEQEAFRTSGILSMERVNDTVHLAGGTEGVFVFGKEGEELAHHPNDPGAPNALGEGYTYALEASGDGSAWVGIMGAGVWSWHPEKGVEPVFRHEPGNNESLSSDYVSTLARDGDSHLWIGTRSNGLNRCHIESRRCQHMADTANSSNPLGDTNITDLYRDRRDRLWVGSDGGGLSLIRQDEDGRVSGIEHWNRDDGLLDNGIMSIEEDLDESLWLGTRHGLGGRAVVHPQGQSSGRAKSGSRKTDRHPANRARAGPGSTAAGSIDCHSVW